MSERRTSMEKMYEDEISMKQIIWVIIENWKMISLVTAVGSIVAVVISFLMDSCL